MIYLVLVYFAILLFYSLKKRYWLPGIFLVSVYTFSLVFSIVLLGTTNEYHVDALSSFLFIIGTFLLFSPFLIKRPVIVANYNANFVKVFSITGYSIGTVIVLCSIVLMPYIKEVFILGLANARAASMEGEQIVEFAARSIPAYSYRMLSMLYPLSYALLLLFFYSFSFYRKKAFLNTVLFLSSFAGIIIGIFNGGRTNVIYWVLSFISFFVIFYPYLSNGKKVASFIISGLFFSIITVYFIAVSDARFGDTTMGTESSLLHYTGTPFLNFCDFIQRYNADHFSLRRIFPFLSEILSGPMNITQYRDIIYQKSHMDIGLFYTMLGDLYVDIGLIGMLIYLSIYSCLAQKNVNKRNYSLSQLLIFLVFYLIPLQGLFYYSYWRSVVTIDSIGIIVYSVFIRRKYNA